MNKAKSNSLIIKIVVIFTAIASVLLWAPRPAAGQIDSLQNVIANQEDTKKKANDMLDLARAYYLQYQLDSAMSVVSELQALSAEIDYSKGAAEAYYLMGIIYERWGELDSAIDVVTRSNELAQTLKNNSIIAKSSWLLGNISIEKGMLQEALEYFKESLAIYKAGADSGRMLSVYNSIGNLYTTMSVYDSAVVYYHIARELCEAVKNIRGLATVYNQLGKIYRLQGQYDEAVRYINMSMEIGRENDLHYELARNYSNMGITLLNMGNPQEALEWFNREEEARKGTGNQVEMAHLYVNKGTVYNDLEDYGLALQSYDTALAYYSKEGHTEGIVTVYINKANIYSTNGRYKNAEVLLDSALAISKRAGLLDRTREVYSSMASNYYSSGNYKKGYDAFNQYYLLNDSIYNLERTELINSLNLKFERERDRAKILALDLQLQKQTTQRNAFLYGGISLVAFVIFLALYFRQRAVKDRIIKEQRIKQLEEEKKLLAAKALVEGQEKERKRIAQELHDGLGVLLSAARMQFTTIRDKSPESRPLVEKAAKLLEQASGDVRKISHNMMPGLLTKLGLLEAVNELLDKVEETSGLKVNRVIPDIEERMPENTEIMLYRIMQEMINNTIKHADASVIRLKIEPAEDVVKIWYEDDGKGFDVEEKLEAKTLGLSGIQSRMNFLNGKLEIKSGEGTGVLYLLEVPVPD